MIIYIILLAVISFCGVKFSSFHDDYIGVKQTTTVKGIFAFMIFLSHSRDYYELSALWTDTSFNRILSVIGQLMVTLFFFYSGYGVLESYKKKENYNKSFFRKRILKTLMHFDFAVLLFLIVTLSLGKKYPIENYFLSWIGWTSFGNSNWFMFVVLLMYVITLASFTVVSVMKSRGGLRILYVVIIVTILACIAWICLWLSGKKSTWFNTLLCYPAGMMYSLLGDKIEKLMKKKRFYYPALLLLSVVFIVLRFVIRNVATYSICACVFCLIIVLVTMKVKFDNPFLQFFGKYSFSIYILQRIPMMLLERVGISQPILFTALAFAVTCIMAVIYDKAMNIIDKKLLKA